MYFNLPDNARVFHLMGAPDETRHIVVANRDVWFRPSGRFIPAWHGGLYILLGMGGENRTTTTWIRLRSRSCASALRAESFTLEL